MSKNLDILLIIPPTRLQVYQGLSNSLAAIEVPVWAGLIANYLDAKGLNVSILDAEALGYDHKQTAKSIAEKSAALNVFVIYGQQPSASTQCMPGGRLVCEHLNDIGDFETIVMGTHPSALPEKTLLEEPYKYVCQGEGPYTIVALLNELKNGKRNFTKVPGLWYIDGDKVAQGPVASLINDLDKTLPQQAWKMLDMSMYRAHNWHCFDDLTSRESYASLQTSLGCPYKCSFCCINAPFGGSGIRYWSAQNILEQIDVLVKDYSIRNIKIPDEMFVLNKRHVIEICDGLIERNYNLNIWAYARIDTIKDEYLEKLKKAGFNWLALGIESGSKHVRDGVEKGRFDEADIIKTVNKIRDHGIYICANYIFGLPDDTMETMRETLDLALEINSEWANFYCAMAYPGSQLHALAQSKSWQLPEDNAEPGWIGYSQHAYDTLPLPTETLPYEQVLDFRDMAFNEYFQSPTYLDMIEKTFGNDVVKHINEMAQHKLARRHHEKQK